MRTGYEEAKHLLNHYMQEAWIKAGLMTRAAEIKRDLPKPNQVYRHFKGGLYKILDFCICTVLKPLVTSCANLRRKFAIIAA